MWVVGFVSAILTLVGYSARDFWPSGGSGTASEQAARDQSEQRAEDRRNDSTDTGVGTTTSTAPTTSTTGATFEPSVSFLSELRPVARSSDIETTAANLGGTSYGNSLVFTCELFCNDSASVARIAYDLSADYTTFAATAGILDTTPNTGETAAFTVLVDGVERFSDRASFGNPLTIDVDVKGALRLELVVTTGHRTVSALEAGVMAAGGESGSFPHAAWADARVQR